MNGRIYLAEYFLASVNINSPIINVPINASLAASNLKSGMALGIKSP
jgi:hypothetical protein